MLLQIKIVNRVQDTLAFRPLTNYVELHRDAHVNQLPNTCQRILISFYPEESSRSYHPKLNVSLASLVSGRKKLRIHCRMNNPRFGRTEPILFRLLLDRVRDTMNSCGPFERFAQLLTKFGTSRIVRSDIYL